jgi:hypothetical protein
MAKFLGASERLLRGELSVSAVVRFCGLESPVAETGPAIGRPRAVTGIGEWLFSEVQFGRCVDPNCRRRGEMRTDPGGVISDLVFGLFQVEVGS